jgi:hypothetical protein
LWFWIEIYSKCCDKCYDIKSCSMFEFFHFEGSSLQLFWQLLDFCVLVFDRFLVACTAACRSGGVGRGLLEFLFELFVFGS